MCQRLAEDFSYPTLSLRGPDWLSPCHHTFSAKELGFWHLILTRFANMGPEFEPLWGWLSQNGISKSRALGQMPPMLVSSACSAVLVPCV